MFFNSFPLRNWDEAWYGEIIKNMATGDYNLLVSFWNGQYYFDKPPLYFWLSLPFYKFFGPGEWQARLVSILASGYCVLLVYLISKKLLGKSVAVVSSLVFLTLGQVYVRLSHGNLDALLVAFSLSSFYFFIKSRSAYFPVLSGIFLGLAYLTKGWFLGLYPLGVMTLYSLLFNKKLIKYLVVTFIVSIISSSWYFILGSVKFGQPFFDWYILNPTASHIMLSSFVFSTKYIKFVIRDMGVWFIPILLHLVKAKLFVDKKYILLITAVIAYTIPLGLLDEYFDWYLLPAYPYLAILIGYSVVRFTKSLKQTVIFLLILILPQIFIVYKIENLYPDRSKVGATLGVRASQLVNKDEKLVLDDHDFTSFLYYSNHGMVYTTSIEGGKKWEWWTLKYKDMEAFIDANGKVLLVTPNLENFQIDYSKMNLLDYYNGYYFLKTK